MESTTALLCALSMQVREEEIDAEATYRIEARKAEMMETKAAKFANIQSSRIKTMRQLIENRKCVPCWPLYTYRDPPPPKQRRVPRPASFPFGRACAPVPSLRRPMAAHDVRVQLADSCCPTHLPARVGYADQQAGFLHSRRFRLFCVRRYVEQHRKLHKPTIVEKYANFGSTTYAPLQRDGRFPESKPLGKDVETEGYAPVTLQVRGRTLCAADCASALLTRAWAMRACACMRTHNRQRNCVVCLTVPHLEALCAGAGGAGRASRIAVCCQCGPPLPVPGSRGVVACIALSLFPTCHRC